MISADDMRYFLEVARTRRLVIAGRRLGVDHATVGRRITNLERTLGKRLFDRSPAGWALTDAGQDLISHAEVIESALVAAMEGSAAGAGKLTGTVRIATPDGFGSFVLAPGLAALCEKNPDLNIQIVTATSLDSLATREFDVGVTLEKPAPTRVNSVELADYRLGLYATDSYLSSHPPITSVLDLYGQSLIGYVDSMLDVPSLKILDTILPGHRARIQTNNITGQWTAAAAGLGVAALPLYVARSNDRLVRVLPEEVVVTLTYWMVIPRELQRLRRVKTAAEALQQIVKIHPDMIIRAD